MTEAQYSNPTINWIPPGLAFSNYSVAFEKLRLPRSFFVSSGIAAMSGFFQIVSCSLVAYGFARMKFPFRDQVFALVLFTFIVPPQTLLLPLYIMYGRFGWTGTPLPFVVPALFGHGLRGSLFVIVFRQFFRQQPWELEEAALIDGCNELQTYWRIMLPLAKPAIVVVGLFSLVWHWNDYFMPSLFLGTEMPSMAMRVQYAMHTAVNLNIDFETGEIITTMVQFFAAAVVFILPPLLLYAKTQDLFVQSVERTGLVE